MCASSYTWSLPVTWQRWWSHHSIRSSRKHPDTRKADGSICYRPDVTGDRSFTLREKEFSTFLLLWPWQYAFIYERDPYSPEIYRMCKYELPKSRLSKVIVTQTQPKLYTTPLCGWSKCTKMRLRLGAAPDTLREFTAHPDPLAGLMGLLLTEWKVDLRLRGWEGEGREEGFKAPEVAPIAPSLIDQVFFSEIDGRPCQLIESCLDRVAVCWRLWALFVAHFLSSLELEASPKLSDVTCRIFWRPLFDDARWSRRRCRFGTGLDVFRLARLRLFRARTIPWRSRFLEWPVGEQVGVDHFDGFSLAKCLGGVGPRSRSAVAIWGRDSAVVAVQSIRRRLLLRRSLSEGLWATTSKIITIIIVIIIMMNNCP